MARYEYHGASLNNGALRSVGRQIDSWTRHPSCLLALMLCSALFCLPGIATGQESERTDYEVKIGEELRSRIIRTMRSARESRHSRRTIHDDLQRYLRSKDGEVMLQGWHVVGYFDGHYLVEYRYLVDGEPPEWGLIYELDLESGWAMHHRMVNGMRGNEILLDMLVWFLFLGFQILIYFYYYVFLFLADHYPLARHGIMTRPQRIVEQCRLMKWSRNRLHPRHRGPGLLGRKPLSG